MVKVGFVVGVGFVVTTDLVVTIVYYSLLLVSAFIKQLKMSLIYCCDWFQSPRWTFVQWSESTSGRASSPQSCSHIWRDHLCIKHADIRDTLQIMSLCTMKLQPSVGDEIWLLHSITCLFQNYLTCVCFWLSGQVLNDRTGGNVPGESWLWWRHSPPLHVSVNVFSGLSVWTLTSVGLNLSVFTWLGSVVTYRWTRLLYYSYTTWALVTLVGTGWMFFLTLFMYVCMCD